MMLHVRSGTIQGVCGYNAISRRGLFNLSRAVKSEERGQKYTIRRKYACSPGLMYGLISRVDLYHEFIPYCTGSFINGRDEVGEPSVGGLRVGFESFDEEFTCALECVKGEKVVAKSITHSLFEFLETEWTLSSVGEKGDECVAELKLRYEFKSELYNRVSSLFAKKVAGLMSKSFERRAYESVHDESIAMKYKL